MLAIPNEMYYYKQIAYYTYIMLDVVFFKFHFFIIILGNLIFVLTSTLPFIDGFVTRHTYTIFLVCYSSYTSVFIYSYNCNYKQ